MSSLFDLSQKVDALEEAIQHLLLDLKDAREETEVYKKRSEQFKIMLAEKDREIWNFQNQHKISKIVSSMVEGSHDLTELKLKINEYIREIDKCIAYLSE